MCNAPSSVSAQWRSAGLIKNRLILAHSWSHKGCRLGPWSKNALMCIAPVEKHLFGVHFPLPQRDWQPQHFLHRAGNSSAVSSWCPNASEGKTKKKVERKVLFSHLWTVLESFCPWDRGLLWSSHPPRGMEALMVSPHHQQSPPLQKWQHPRGETMSPLFIAVLSVDVVLCHHFRLCQARHQQGAARIPGQNTKPCLWLWPGPLAPWRDSWRGRGGLFLLQGGDELFLPHKAKEHLFVNCLFLWENSVSIEK